MPIDASIYSQLNTQPVDPLASVGRVMAIKNMMGQQQLQELQRQNLGLNIGDQMRLRDLFASNPNPTPQEVMAASPATGISYAKAISDRALADAKTQQAVAATQAQTVKTGRDLLASASSDADYSAWQQYMVAHGWKGDPGMPQSVSDPNFATWREKKLMTADQLLDRLKPVYQMTNLGGTSEVLQVNPNAPGAATGPLEHTMTPGEKASNKVALANYELNRSRAIYEGVPVPGAGGTPTAAPGQPSASPAAPAAAAATAATPAAPTGGPAPVPGVLPVVGAKEIKSLPPKMQAELQAKRLAEKPQDLTSLEEMNANADQAIDLAKQILAHKGLSAATGWSSYTGAIPGTPMYDVAKMTDTLKGQVMLALLKSMRAASTNGSSGFGQLSNAEGDTLRNSITNLDRAQTTDQFKAALSTLVNSLNGSKERLARGYERIYGEAPETKAYHTTVGTTPAAAPTMDEIDAELRKRGVIR